MVTSLLAAAGMNAWALPTVTESEQRSRSELLRQQERQTQSREALERTPDVRLNTPNSTATNLPGDEAPCFTIRQLEIQGDESAQFGWVLDALAGPGGVDGPLRKCIGAKGISVLLQRAQEALVAKGFVTTRIFAQPQDLAQGNLSFTVVPGRIGSIRWPTNVNTAMQSAIPARPGDILNLRDIEQALENFKRVPTAEADIQITPADAPNQSDLVIRYTQGFPLRGSLSLDDSGNKSTGKYQASATVSWDNPLGLNDLFYLTTTQDAGGGDPGPRGTRGMTLHYSLPYGYWSLGTTFSDSRYSQTVVGTSQNYVYSGTSGNAEIKLARMVYRDALGKTTAHLKAFERHSRNFIDDTEVQVQRRAVGGWELGVGHKQFVGPATVDATLSYKRGTPDFASIAAPEEASGEGTSRFGLVAAEASLSWPFKAGNQSLRYNGQLRLQNNTTSLTPQDRFSIGGRYTVRGFDGETSLSGERGYVLRNDLSAALGDSGQELYVGVDQGEVDGPSSDLLVGKRLSGAVIGLRGSVKKLQYDVFVGTPLYQPNGFRAADTSAGFSLNLSF